MILLFTASILASCGGTKKIVNKAEKTFRGAWALNDITYPGSKGEYKVILFNDASKNCFMNSDWFFVENNNTGTYTLTGSDCTLGERNFRWDVQAVNPETQNFDFLLKPVNEKGKSETNTGFRVNLISLTETTMVWEQTVSVDGKPFTIRMNFNKK